MTKTFDFSSIPYCTKNLRHYLQPLSTTDELAHLKQYFHYQKHLAIRLIKYQRSLTSEYNRQAIRFNNRLCVDKKLFENFGLSPIRSNLNEFIINKNRFNRTLNLSDIHKNNLHNINKPRQMCSRLASKTSLARLDYTESRNKTIDAPLIKLNTCSTIIATGYGMRNAICLSSNTDAEQLYYNAMDEDISLSKTCKKKSNRSSFRRKIHRKSSSIYFFTIPNKRSQNK